MSLPAARIIPVVPLTREAFRPFGDVLDASGPPDDVANQGAALVFRDRAEVDVAADHGRLSVNLVRTQPTPLPLLIERMERHPLGSQAFSPLSGHPWLAIVAPAGDLDPEAIVAIHVRSDQGLNYRRGVWHHPLIALGGASDFLVIERAGEGVNLEIETLARPLLIADLGS